MNQKEERLLSEIEKIKDKIFASLQVHDEIKCLAKEAEDGQLTPSRMRNVRGCATKVLCRTLDALSSIFRFSINNDVNKNNSKHKAHRYDDRTMERK